MSGDILLSSIRDWLCKRIPQAILEKRARETHLSRTRLFLVVAAKLWRHNRSRPVLLVHVCHRKKHLPHTPFTTDAIDHLSPDIFPGRRHRRRMASVCRGTDVPPVLADMLDTVQSRPVQQDNSVIDFIPRYEYSFSDGAISKRRRC